MTPQEHEHVARSYRPAVRGWVSRCVSARDVDDVTHEVFVRLARSFVKVDVARAEAWLRHAARSCVVDYARKRREDLTDPPPPPSEQPDPEQTLRSKQLAAAVQEGLRSVAAPRRDVLVAVALEGRTVADVAREQGIPETTAQSRMEQGARDLRAVMERTRAAKKRRGGFTSWGVMWAILDWRLRALAWLARVKALALRLWPKAVGFVAAATGIGAIVGAVTMIVDSARADPLAEEVPAVAFETRPLAFAVDPPMAPSSVERPVEVVRPRRRHDEHAHFEREAFGAASGRWAGRTSEYTRM